MSRAQAQSLTPALMFFLDVSEVFCPHLRQEIRDL